MYKFKLSNSNNQEIWLAITTKTEKFLVKFDVFDQQIDLLEVCAGEHEILDIIDDNVMHSIESKVFEQLKKEDQQNYINAIAA